MADEAQKEETKEEKTDTGAPLNAPMGVEEKVVDWRKDLPENIKNLHPEIKDVAGLMNAHVNIVKKIGANPIIKPGENATDEEKGKYYQELGRPEKVEGYEFAKAELPEGMEVNETVMSGMKESFFKRGLTKEQAEGVVADYMKGQSSAFTQSAEAAQAEINTTQATLKTKWGENYDTNAKMAVSLAEKEFTPEFLKSFKVGDTLLGNHPEMVAFLHKVATMNKEDSLEGESQPGANSASADELERKAKEMMKNNKAYFDPGDPDHASTRQTVSEYFKQANAMRASRK